MRFSRMMVKITEVPYSSCNVQPLPPFLKAMLSVASSVKYRVCAEQVNGTWAGDGTWQQNTWRKPTNRVIHAKTPPYSTSATGQRAYHPENTNEPYGESPVSPAIGAYFNKKAYTDPALRKEYTNKGFWVNIRLIRYADVLLMGAESANEKGIPGEAIDYLEQVRARARGTNSNILPKVTTTDQGELREAIRHERRVELGLEFDRFYDLVRWGIAKEVLHAAGKTNYQDKNALLPLPQTEIDKSKGC